MAQQHFANQWAEWTTEACKPLLALNQVTSNVLKRTAEQQLELFKSANRVQGEYIKALSGTKKLEDIQALQSKLVTEGNEKIAAFAKQSFDNYLATTSEVSDWIEKGVQAVVKGFADSAVSASEK